MQQITCSLCLPCLLLVSGMTEACARILVLLHLDSSSVIQAIQAIQDLFSIDEYS
jgi:hypothetical protein